MGLEQLLKVAARATWRQRSWWGLGLLGAAGGMLINLILRGAGWILAASFSPRNLDLQAILERAGDAKTLLIAVAAVLFLGMVLWLSSAIADGALIMAAAAHLRGDALAFGQAVKAGLGLVGRFLAIDALIFLPLFLLALALMVVGFGGLLGLVVTATRPAAETIDLLIVAGLTAMLSIPLLLGMLLASLLILVMRALAFRATALDSLKATASIGRAWRILRAGPLAVATLALVLAAIRSLVGTPVRTASFILGGLGWSQIALGLTEAAIEGSELSTLVGLGSVILALVSWFVSGIMNAYSSLNWTLGYVQWSEALE